MYFLGWFTLVIISLAVSLFVFFWALESGQFSDQDRARYLPLVDVPAGAPVSRRSSGRGVYALLAVIVLSAGMFMAPIVLTLYHMVGG